MSQEDITPPEKRSVRNIAFPGSNHNKGTDDGDAPRRSGNAEKPRLAPPPPRVRSKKGKWLMASAVVVLLYFGFTAVFSGARVKVTARQESIPISGEFIAKIAPQQGELPFEVVSFEKELSRDVTATGEEHRKTKASGTIVVYNNFGNAPLRLIKNTRFESDSGKIYRIQEAIAVPGKKTSGDPGSIEVTVYADASGEQYNLESGRFTLPGLKGDERYKEVYAETKNPLIGGFEGVVRSVSEDAEREVRLTMREDLKNLLQEDVANLGLQGFLVLKDTMNFSFNSLPPVPGTTANVAVLREKGMLHVALFDQKELSKYLASRSIAGYGGEDLTITNFGDLTFAVSEETSVRTDIDEIRFSIKGTANMFWAFEEENLRGDLAGKSKRQINTVLAAYPGIQKAEVTIRPFWGKSFPDNKNKIAIVLLDDSESEKVEEDIFIPEMTGN